MISVEIQAKKIMLMSSFYQFQLIDVKLDLIGFKKDNDLTGIRT